MPVDAREELLDMISNLLEARQFAELKERLIALPPADIAELIEDVPVRDRALMFRLIPKDVSIEVFEELSPDEQFHLLSSFGDEYVASIVEEMSPDDRARLFEEMPAGVTARLMRVLSQEERRTTALLLGYGENTAGRIMTPEYVSLHADMTAEQALIRIRRVGLDKETIYYAYVTDESRHLVGVVSLKDLVLARPDKPVADLMNQEVIYAHTDDDQEDVAEMLSRYDLLAVPIVDSEDRLVGIVTVDDAADILEEEATEDILKMGAVEVTDMAYEHAGIGLLWRKRIVWLLFLLGAQFISSGVIARYQRVLESAIALSFFIPMLIGSGGNTGTQASTLIIRGLATGGVDVRQWLEVVWKEIRIGLLLGITLGVVVFFAGSLLVGRREVGLVVASSMIALVIWANMIGSLLPMILTRLNLDPAVASSPFIATLSDVTGLLIYFTIASQVLEL